MPARQVSPRGPPTGLDMKSMQLIVKGMSKRLAQVEETLCHRGDLPWPHIHKDDPMPARQVSPGSESSCSSMPSPQASPEENASVPKLLDELEEGGGPPSSRPSFEAGGGTPSPRRVADLRARGGWR